MSLRNKLSSMFVYLIFFLFLALAGLLAFSFDAHAEDFQHSFTTQTTRSLLEDIYAKENRHNQSEGLDESERLRSEEARWSLQEFVYYGLKNSPSLAAERLSLEIVELDKKLASFNRRFGFRLDVETFSGFSTGRRVVIGGVVVSDKEDNLKPIDPLVSLHLNYPIFNEGSFISQESVSEHIASLDLEKTTHDFNRKKRELIYAVAKLFVELGNKEKVFDAHNNNLKLIESLISASSERYEKRLITKADRLESEYLRKKIESKIKVTSLEIELLEKRLLYTIGMPFSEAPPLRDYNSNHLSMLEADIPDKQTLFGLMLENSSEIANGSLDLKKSELEKKLFNTELMPVLFFTSTSTFTVNDKAQFLGAGISFPLHSLFRRLFSDPDFGKAELVVELNRMRLEAAKRDLDLRFVETYNRWLMSRELSSSLLTKLDAKRARVEETESRFKSGLANMGEFLEHVLALEEVNIEYNEQKSQEQIELLALLLESGLIEDFVLR